jgi:sensor histidine kinase YesM
MNTIASASMIEQQWLLGFIMSKKWRFVKHIILIIPILSTFIPDVSRGNQLHISNYDILVQSIYIHLGFLFCIAIVLIYTNLYVLVPRLLFKRKYLLYALAALLFGVVYFLADSLHGAYVYRGFEQYVTTPRFTIKDFIDTAILPMVFLGSTTGYKVFKKWIIDNQHLNDLQKAQLQEELTNLKNQVNPHFLFNTLNNLSTLIQTDTEKAIQVVLGLSDVLKYQIYDSNKEMILLSKDIDILSQFLMLEKIRRDRFSYEILVEDNIEGILLPPLLFINFIDNAVKHSLDNRNISYIKIRFSVKENQLFFMIENSKPSFIIQSEKGGLGLKNVQRRLQLLYGEDYELQLNDQPNKYTVHLKIPL